MSRQALVYSSPAQVQEVDWGPDPKSQRGPTQGVEGDMGQVSGGHNGVQAYQKDDGALRGLKAYTEEEIEEWGPLGDYTLGMRTQNLKICPLWG